MTNKDTDVETPEQTKIDEAVRSRRLLIIFVFYLFNAFGNRLFSKLQTIPMHNYALLLNLILSFFYIPVCFTYFFYQIYFGTRITREMRNTKLWVFIVLGGLDAVAGTMQTFGFTYISSGGLIVLLLQAAIPVSMVASYVMLKQRYKVSEYTGAALVVIGLVIAVVPSFITKETCSYNQTVENVCPKSSAQNFMDECAKLNETACNGYIFPVPSPAPAPLAPHKMFEGNGPIAPVSYISPYNFGALSSNETLPGCKWAKKQQKNPVLYVILFVGSTIPMAASMVFKEKNLVESDLDAIYLNGWVSLWQFLVSLPITYLTAPLAGIDLAWDPIMKNIGDGAKCWFGVDSVLTDNDKFCKDNCSSAPIFVWIYMFFNIFYNILIILMLKYGGSTLYFVVSVLLVPMLNLCFSLPFMPEVVQQSFTWETIVSLLIVVGGLLVYRFYGRIAACFQKSTPEERIALNSE